MRLPRLAGTAPRRNWSAIRGRRGYTFDMSHPPSPTAKPRRVDEAVAAVPFEWVGKLGDKEPDACASMTPAERIEMVWPITLTAWAFSGKPCDESRLRRDVESVSRRKR